jgi:hypothetical protein
MELLTSVLEIVILTFIYAKFDVVRQATTQQASSSLTDGIRTCGLAHEQQGKITGSRNQDIKAPTCVGVCGIVALRESNNRGMCLQLLRVPQWHSLFGVGTPRGRGHH